MKSFWKSLCLFVASFLLSITILHTLPVGAQTPSRAPVSGSCDCPYDSDSSGRRCGGRSAYSRPGGRSPVCYVDNAPASGSAPQVAPSAPVESAYDRYMRIAYAASGTSDYQTALINFRRALAERPGDRFATEAIANMEAAIERSR